MRWKLVEVLSNITRVRLDFFHAWQPTKNSKSIERNCTLGKKSPNSGLYSFFELKILNFTFTRLGEACGAKLASLAFEKWDFFDDFQTMWCHWNEVSIAKLSFFTKVWEAAVGCRKRDQYFNTVPRLLPEIYISSKLRSKKAPSSSFSHISLYRVCESCSSFLFECHRTEPLSSWSLTHEE